jgi:zinc transporter ZupT
MMAFGAGALLFAVTIELYAHALHELRTGHIGFFTEMCVILLAALCGAMFYLFANRHLEEYMLGEDDYETASKAEAGIGTHSSAGSSTTQSEAVLSKSTPPWPTKKKADETTPLVEKKTSPILASQAVKKSAEGASSTAGAGAGASASDGAGETAEEKKKRLNLKAKAMWKKAKTSVKFSNFVRMEAKRNVRGREKGMRHLLAEVQRVAGKIGLESSPRASRVLGKSNSQVEFEVEERDAVVQRAKLVALQLFLGLLVDGVPEAILMGFLAARGHLTPVFIVALFFANFPEAFSSASLLTVAKQSWYGIIGMWTFLCILVGSVAGFACWALLAMYPGYATGEALPVPVLIGIATIEGLTGGSMIACIAAVMLPEAFERMGKEPPLLLSSGFMCTCGFLSAVLLKAMTD